MNPAHVTHKQIKEEPWEINKENGCRPNKQIRPKYADRNEGMELSDPT